MAYSRPSLQSKVCEEPAFFLADRRLNFQIGLEPAAVELVPQELVELEEPCGILQLDRDPNRLLFTRVDRHTVYGCSGYLVDGE